MPSTGVTGALRSVYAFSLRTQKPALRITKWVRRIQTAGPRIPLEAECTAWTDPQFKIKPDTRNEYRFFYRSDHDYNRNLSVLQREFEKHLKLVHPDESQAKSQT